MVTCPLTVILPEERSSSLSRAPRTRIARADHRETSEPGGKLIVGRPPFLPPCVESPRSRGSPIFSIRWREPVSTGLQVRIRRRGPDGCPSDNSTSTVYGYLNRPNGATRPSGFWIPARLAAARDHYDTAQEGHSYVYSQRSVIVLNCFLEWLPSASASAKRRGK